MQCSRNICQDLYWVGGNDRRIALFENVFPVPDGVSYNSYLALDEKTVLLDTVDHSISGVFFENLKSLLGDRPLDYVVINHMEPDHAATLAEVVRRWPQVTLVGNAKTLKMMDQFFELDLEGHTLVVKEGDVLNTGRHAFTFVMAPMVHWPEVMVTYDTTDKILFSADAFGTFGALSGNLFADEMDFAGTWLAEARRYYTNIVGKYGTQVQALLKKASALEISYICPLHGPIWRKNTGWFIEKYQRWSTYTPEDNTVMIAYASVYGDTENAAEILAGHLADLGVQGIRMYDVSKTDPSVIVAEAFRCSHLVFASTTYNAGIFCKMETVLQDLVAHNLQNRTVAVIENGSWAATAGNLMCKLLLQCKGITLLDDIVSLKSSVKAPQCEELGALAQQLADSLPKAAPIVHTAENKVEPSAMFKLSYGLFVLSARSGNKDNGCIINTVTQLTDSPKRISVAVNKANLTRDMIADTGVFNVSVLSTEAPFELFSHFGFQSGRDTDKFDGWKFTQRSENGLCYLTACTNAFLSAKVVAVQEFETHTLFIAEITEAKVLSNEASVTYAYYFEHIKPKPQPTAEKKKGWVCKICGYVYEGEELPDDFICPLCKHGKEDFEPLS